jgi:hypothetical protein
MFGGTKGGSAKWSERKGSSRQGLDPTRAGADSAGQQPAADRQQVARSVGGASSDPLYRNSRLTLPVQAEAGLLVVTVCLRKSRR